MKSTYTVSSIGKFAGQALLWLRCLMMAIFALASFCAALLLPIASASVARNPLRFSRATRWMYGQL